MNRKSLFLILSIFGLTVLLSACAPASEPTETAGKIHVVASFYPLAHFAQQVGGDLVEVTNLTPVGAEPHDFEPSPGDLARLLNADLFVFHGAGMEPWAGDLMPELEEKGVRKVEISSFFSLLEGGGEEQAHEKNHEEEEHEEEEHPLSFDPHLWLDPVLVQRQVEILRDTFAEMDPAHAEQYRQQAKAYEAELQHLDSEFQKGLKTCRLREAIVSHDAFRYLGKRYGITFIPLADLSPQAEPSPRRLAEIADLAEEKGVKYIFFETLVSPRLSQTLAKEVGAETLVLNPLEGLTEKEMTEGKTYTSVMLENFHHLQIALECEK